MVMGLLAIAARALSFLAVVFVFDSLTVRAQAPVSDPPAHPVDGSFVREWLVLGPFRAQELDTDFLAEAGGEGNVRPKEGDFITRSDGSRLAWTRYRSESDMANIRKVLGNEEFAVAYAYCELNSEQEMETDVRAYSYDQGWVWLNGKRVGQTFNSMGTGLDVPPALPIQLKPGRNALLLKLQMQRGFWHFLTQPLPGGRATAGLHVTDQAGKPVAGALVQFYDQGELAGRVRTDQGGVAQACLFPAAAVYDVRITAGEMGAWQFGVALPPGGRRRLDVTLTNAVSISGRALAMDRSPQNRIVVQAIAVPDSTAAESSPSKAPIKPLLPLPAFSETVLTDTNGAFRFVNLRPGRYQLRCHGPDGFIYPEGAERTTPSGSMVIATEAGRTAEGVVFQFGEAKKGVWKSYPITQGLRELNPVCIHRTPDGLLWIGTDKSFLYAYDGVEFKLMASTPEIPANEILALAHGADGTIWIGTAGGISRQVEGRTQTLPFDETVARKAVNDILVAPDGTVWFATASGLGRYDGRKLVMFTVRNGLPSNFINRLLWARDGTLWIGTENGLAHFDGKNFTELQPVHGIGERGVTKLHQTKDGAIWFIGSQLGGAYRYDGKAFSRLGVENGLASAFPYDMAETSDGALWFATDVGLSKFNGTTVVNYGEEDGLSNLWVRKIFVDSDDVLWCANGWGVSRFDPKGFIRFGQRDGLSRSDGGLAEVFAFEPEPDGNVLIGTGWTGIFRSDGKSLQPVTSSLPKPYVRQIYRATDGTLWFGTESGILKLDGGQMVRVLERSWVIALCSDDQGNLWYGHGWNGGGLSRYNPKTGVETVFAKAQGLPDDQVWAVEPSAEGDVWVGTGAGLARFHDGKIEDFRERLGIPTGAVFDLRRDASETLWIGSRQGLHRLKGSERVSITVTNGLPDQHVWCSARTADGKIWMGTDSNGLLGYDGKAVTALDKRDGLSGNSVFTVKTNADGSLWIGFLDGGLTRYQPTTTRPSVRVRGALLDQQTLTNLSKFPDIPTGHRVTIQYQEIDPKTHPDKRQFWYRLANRAGETVFAAATKDRRFDWVPEKAGGYTFEIQAIDRDLNYSEPARVLMQVTVPWHANAWILTPIVAAFGGLLVWAFVAWKLYGRKNRETALLRERVRISRDLHDHLGAGLTHLAMVGDLVRQQTDKPEAVQMLATRLSESARELTRTMGEVIWATDPDKDTLRSFALFVTRYAEGFFAASALRLRFDIPAELPDVVLPSEVRNSLFMVAKEAMNNVAKHAQASELRIKLELGDRELRLSFEDDGHGFSRNQVALGRHGLVNMEERLRDLGGQLEIESGPGQGTRVYARAPLPKK